jgi:probable rRNA maturation factor
LFCVKTAIRLFNRQKAHALPLPWLRRVMKHALPLCLAAAKPGDDCVLPALPEIEATLIDDAEIARVHGEFLDDATPTDVITFHHGEILVSVETAARQAPDHGALFEHEVALYLIHGLLHLAGWHDHDPAEAHAMAETQQRILQQCLLGVER